MYIKNITYKKKIKKIRRNYINKKKNYISDYFKC